MLRSLKIKQNEINKLLTQKSDKVRSAFVGLLNYFDNP
jgi:hypothetical protein